MITVILMYLLLIFFAVFITTIIYRGIKKDIKNSNIEKINKVWMLFVAIVTAAFDIATIFELTRFIISLVRGSR